MKKKQENDEVNYRSKAVKKDIGKYSALEALKHSEGGQLITSALKKDIISAIDKISRIYKKGNLGELVAISAELTEKIAVFRTISRSSKNKMMASEELESILDENEEDVV